MVTTKGCQPARHKPCRRCRDYECRPWQQSRGMDATLAAVSRVLLRKMLPNHKSARVAPDAERAAHMRVSSSGTIMVMAPRAPTIEPDRRASLLRRGRGGVNPPNPGITRAYGGI